jgi:hypothetical protein
MADQLHSGLKHGAIKPIETVFSSLGFVPNELSMSSFICKEGSSDQQVMEENGESKWISPKTVDQAFHVWRTRHVK